jgi:cysteine-rich repeat protein
MPCTHCRTENWGGLRLCNDPDALQLGADGRWRRLEECDDGNNNAGDGCSPNCTIEDGFSNSSPDPAASTPLLRALTSMPLVGIMRATPLAGTSGTVGWIEAYLSPASIARAIEADKVVATAGGVFRGLLRRAAEAPGKAYNDASTGPVSGDAFVCPCMDANAVAAAASLFTNRRGVLSQADGAFSRDEARCDWRLGASLLYSSVRLPPAIVNGAALRSGAERLIAKSLSRPGHADGAASTNDGECFTEPCDLVAAAVRGHTTTLGIPAVISYIADPPASRKFSQGSITTSSRFTLAYEQIPYAIRQATTSNGNKPKQLLLLKNQRPGGLGGGSYARVAETAATETVQEATSLILAIATTAGSQPPCRFGGCPEATLLRLQLGPVASGLEGVWEGVMNGRAPPDAAAGGSMFVPYARGTCASTGALQEATVNAANTNREISCAEQCAADFNCVFFSFYYPRPGTIVNSSAGACKLFSFCEIDETFSNSNAAASGGSGSKYNRSAVAAAAAAAIAAGGYVTYRVRLDLAIAPCRAVLLVRGHVIRLSVPTCGNAVGIAASFAGVQGADSGLRRRSPQVGALVGTILPLGESAPWGDGGWAAECSPLVSAEVADADRSGENISGWPHACSEGGSGLQKAWRARVRWTLVSSDRAVGNVDAAQWVRADEITKLIYTENHIIVQHPNALNHTK